MKITWRELNNVLSTKTEGEVWNMLQEEKKGHNRVAVLIRLHQRYCSLRDSRGTAGVNKVAVARQRHGKPFAFESGSNWKPRQVPLLTEWLQGRGREEAK